MSPAAALQLGDWLAGDGPAGDLLCDRLLLAFHFRADADQAYASICDVTSVVPYGWLVRNIHRFAAEGLLLVAVAHLLRVLLTRSYTGTCRGNWLVGIGLLGLILLANFTGYLLPWDQTAYWGMTICLSMLDAVPVLDGILRGLLAGPPPLDGAALPRLYTLHAIIVPAGLLLLASHHRRRFRQDVTRHAPASTDPEKVSLGWSDLWHWELAAGFAELALLVMLATYVDASLEGPANPHEPPNLRWPSVVPGGSRERVTRTSSNPAHDQHPTRRCHRPAPAVSVRYMNLSITHISGQAEAEVDVGQPGHAAPEDPVAGGRVSGSIQIAAESGKPDQELANGSLS